MPEGNTTHGSVLEQMDTFLERVREGELGKEASANLDLAGDAKSTHPSANVDDGTQPAREGSRSSENESDVKKQTPNSINNEDTKNQAGGSTNFADTQGTESMASDSGLKGNVDTPKKDHSKSMTDSGPGDDTFDNNWDKASAADKAGLLLKEGNELLAAVAGLSKSAEGDDGEEAPAAPAGDETAPEAAPAEAPSTEAPAEAPAEGGDDKEAQARADLYKEAADQYPEDMEAGYVAAAMLAQQLGLGQTKEAAEAAQQQTAATVEALRKQARDDADLYCSFLDGYEKQGSQKQAGLEELLGGAGGAPEAGAGDPAALAGEGEAGGEMGAGMAGAGDAAGMGGMAGAGDPAGAAGGEPSDEESIAAIAELLDEAGISAEDLAAALQEAQGGGEGEMMGGEGGEAVPPEALAALGGGAGGGMEAAAAGAPATTKTGSGSRRDALKKLARAYLKGGK
jgi:hypothetical protein